MRTHVQLIASLLLVGLLTATGCSRGDRSPTSMFDGVWIGWLLPQEPNTFDLTWNVWVSKGVIIMTATKDSGNLALGKVKFSVTQETVEADETKGLLLQTDKGPWKLVFGKDGESLGVYDALGRFIGGFKYVTDTRSLQPEDYHFTR